MRENFTWWSVVDEGATKVKISSFPKAEKGCFFSYMKCTSIRHSLLMTLLNSIMILNHHHMIYTNMVCQCLLFIKGKKRKEKKIDSVQIQWESYQQNLSGIIKLMIYYVITANCCIICGISREHMYELLTSFFIHFIVCFTHSHDNQYFIKMSVTW